MPDTKHHTTEMSMEEDLRGLKELYADYHFSDVLFVFPYDAAGLGSANDTRKSSYDESDDEEELFQDPMEARLVPAHRLVLSLRSGAFKDALWGASNSQMPSNLRFPIKIHIQDTSYHVFTTLLRFLYTDEAPDAKSQYPLPFWKDLLRASVVYMVPSLAQTCVSRTLALMKDKAADSTYLADLLELLIFSDEIVTVASKKNVCENGPKQCTDKLRGLEESIQAVQRLQQECMDQLKTAPDDELRLLLSTDIGKRCSTSRLTSILRMRSDSPLVVAIRYQLSRAVNELVKEGTGIGKEEPLRAALETGNDTITRRLLVDVDAPYYLLTDKVPLFLLPCFNGDETQCSILLDHDPSYVNLISTVDDVDKDIQNMYGRQQTPLHIASKQGHASIVRLLLSKEAVPNLQDSEGNTPLHYASNQDTAEALLTASAQINPNIPNKRGQTPLHVTSADGHEDVVKLLLAHGGDLEIVDDQGQTAFHLASASGYKQVALALMESIQNEGDTEGESQMDVNQEDYKSNTALHLAATAPSDRCESMVRLLLDRGADASKANWFGYTPLHLFCAHQTEPPSLIDAFVDHGANIHAQSLDGSTALHLAVGSGSERLAVSLAASGAFVHLQDAAGRSVVELAETTHQGALTVPVLRNLSKEPGPRSGPDAQPAECESCRSPFRLAMRRHQCGHCGRLICYNCCSRSISIPKFKQMKPMRVCDTCFDVLSFRRLL